MKDFIVIGEFVRRRETCLIAKKKCKYLGFNVRPGFFIILHGKKITAITSGWCNDGKTEYYVYRQKGGKWIGEWEDRYTFPVELCSNSIEEYLESISFAAAIKEAKEKEKNGEPVFMSDVPLHFTDVVGGEKCNNGGEYGFWTTYIPTKYDGVYKVYTHTSCDFDSCGTGYQGIKVLTESDYVQLRSESDKIEEEGSLY